jgi:hypothetical protein
MEVLGLIIAFKFEIVDFELPPYYFKFINIVEMDFVNEKN